MTRTGTVLPCYREACNEPAHGLGYNRITHGLYCLAYAERIQAASIQEPGGPFFPLLHLRSLPDGGAWQQGMILVRPQPPKTSS